MGSDPTQVGSQANTLVMDIRKRKGEWACSEVVKPRPACSSASTVVDNDHCVCFDRDLYSVRPSMRQFL